MLIEIKTMGCRLNHAETAAIAGALEAHGHDVRASGAAAGNGAARENAAAAADVFILHTCTVTGAAQSEALRLARSAKKRGIPIVAVSGCGIGAGGGAAFSEAGADLLIDKNARTVDGADQFGIGSIVLSASALGASADGGGAAAAPVPKHPSTRAFVKIQDGCSFRCAYCIVPDARGAPASRPAADVLREIEALGARGFREFVLAGVNVALWRDGALSLCGLAEKIAALGCVSRIRLSSIEPATTERAVIDQIAAPGSKLCRALHYPLQSADDGVLRLMRRRYTAGDYARTLDYAAAKIAPLPLGIGADVITGFPGETDAAFERTRAFIASRPFTYLHVFPYSERPGTPAAAMPGKIPTHIRRARARELISLGEEKTRQFAASLIGRELEALIERIDASGHAHGWTSEYISASIGGLAPSACGSVIRFTASSADGTCVVGQAEEIEKR